MELDLIKINNLINDTSILEGINELVNTFYKDDINTFLDKRNITTDDKRVLLMFLIMYFFSYLSIPKSANEYFDIKNVLKVLLSDLIKDPIKRAHCLEMYKTFEKTTRLIGLGSNSENINKITEH